MISFHLTPSIDMKIYFYEKVDQLLYSYRNNIKGPRLHYQFSRTGKNLSNLRIETSTGLAELSRVQFKNFKKLEIKVNNHA